MEREVLINLFPKSDYEKLLFATRYINELKESLRIERAEKRELLAEIDDLNYRLGECLQSGYEQKEQLQSEIEELNYKLKESLALAGVQKEQSQSEIDTVSYQMQEMIRQQAIKKEQFQAIISDLNYQLEKLRQENIEKRKLQLKIDDLNYQLTLTGDLKYDFIEIKKLESVEIKKLKLQISELKTRLSEEQNFTNRIAHIEAKKADIYLQCKEQVKTLEERIQRYYITRDDLICKLLALTRKTTNEQLPL